MTESLKTMLCGAKTLDEAFDILCAHGDGLSQDDQMKMFKMVTGKDELTEEELDMVVGGSWAGVWKTIKSAGNSALNATAKWCNNHKNELIIAACTIAGVALGVAGASGLVLLGVAEGTVGATAAVGTIVGGTIGALAGAVTVGIMNNKSEK